MAKSDLDQNYTQQKAGHYFWEGATRRPADAGCRRDLRPSTSSITAGRPASSRHVGDASRRLSLRPATSSTPRNYVPGRAACGRTVVGCDKRGSQAKPRPRCGRPMKGRDLPSLAGAVLPTQPGRGSVRRLLQPA